MSPSVADKSKPNAAELQESLKKLQAELDAERYVHVNHLGAVVKKRPDQIRSIQKKLSVSNPPPPF